MIEASKCNFVTRLQHLRLLGGLLSLMIVVCTSTADAYQLYDWKWPQPSTTFYVDIPGTDGDEIWNTAFESAMYLWGVDTKFKFMIVRGVYEDPCDPTEGRNGVGFYPTNCGDAWGSTTLAITTSWHVGSITTQTDIAFNNNESWNVYSTPWQSWPWYGVNDFQRVAVHELGHALGLGHEDSGIATIMGTYVGDIIIPQQDDINGAGALYGFPIIDTDGDGVPDITDICPNDPLKSVNAGQCGCGVVDTDSDGDGTADCNDECPNDPANDIDSDGICGDTDCDDNDASVHPGASEVCDNKDNDCDGSIDEGLLSTFYLDSDSDGYGDISISEVSCSASIGYIADSTDCDDNNASINPGASDANCNGVDNDCANGIDDGYIVSPTTCGIGACGSAGQLQCQNGTEVNTCTAGSPTTEICDDAIDQDCNGIDLICVDSDGDGLSDDVEDANQNGIVDEGETDPNNPDTDDDGLLDGDDPVPYDPYHPCVDYDYFVVNPYISTLASSDTDRVVFFDASQSDCYEMVSCIKEDRVCLDTWDFGGDGNIVGGNGYTIFVYRYDTSGDYAATLTIMEQNSGTVASENNIPVTAEIVQIPLPALDFVTELSSATLELTIEDLDPADSDLDSVVVFWGDRYRTEYSGLFPTTINHAYTRTGTDYHIRVKTENTDGQVFNYTFMDDIDLTVTIPFISDRDSDGYTDLDGDCDDDNADIYPGALEICGDGIDQDCSGSDEICPPDPSDIDNDGDGFTANQGDCKDDDPSINPSAQETCDDGIDQDCDGIDQSCRFLDNEDGTISDTNSGLMWAATSNTYSISWDDAATYCVNSTEGDYTDWRMPTAWELSDLYSAGVRGNYQHDYIKIDGVGVWSSAFGEYYHFEDSTWYYTSGEASWRRALPVRSKQLK